MVIMVSFEDSNMNKTNDSEDKRTDKLSDKHVSEVKALLYPE
ncbi:MAG: hypothetical protein Q8942_12120 [Bacillota bacterium]|nr:hypothetical protein [Bacillota bacterium]